MLSQTYGDFFLAELIEAQDDTMKCLVAEVCFSIHLVLVNVPYILFYFICLQNSLITIKRIGSSHELPSHGAWYIHYPQVALNFLILIGMTTDHLIIIFALGACNVFLWLFHGASISERT